jgi:hypothetical protein
MLLTVSLYSLPYQLQLTTHCRCKTVYSQLRCYQHVTDELYTLSYFTLSISCRQQPTATVSFTEQPPHTVLCCASEEPAEPLLRSQLRNSLWRLLQQYYQLTVLHAYRRADTVNDHCYCCHCCCCCCCCSVPNAAIAAAMLLAATAILALTTHCRADQRYAW